MWFHTDKQQNTDLTQQQYSALVTALGEGALVSITDKSGRITYANDTFVHVSKYTRDELIGQSHRMLKSGHQDDQMFVHMWADISSGKRWRGEIKNRAKDGSYYWVDTVIVPILNVHGKPEQYVSVRFLITDKKQAEERLQQKNNELLRNKQAVLNILEDVQEEKSRYQEQVVETQKFALAVEYISEHVVITDTDGVILYANPAVEKITGFSVEEIVGKKAGNKQLWGGNMDKDFYAAMWHTIKEKKQTFSGEITNRRKNGELYTATSTISPVLGRDGTVLFFVGVERDISEQKRVDQAKTEFVSLASHQLRTPLSSIKWYAEMLLDGDVGTLTEGQREYVTEMYHGNERMIALVNALLNVSRLELGTFIIEPQAVDMAAVCQSVVDELRPSVIKKKLKILLDPAQFPATFSADPGLFRIVIQNLLSNAVKYTPEQGTIRIRAGFIDKNRSKGKKKITQDSFCIEVADTGMGIPEAQHQQIFKKLFRADNVKATDTDGTGLGLYIVKSIIDTAGGAVWFVSKEDRGTTFYVTIPKAGMQPRSGTKALT